MNVAVIVLLAILLLILVLLLMPVRILLDYKKNEQTNETAATLRYMFFKLNLLRDKKKEKPKKEKKEKKPESFEEKRNKVSRYIRIFDEIKADVAEILDYASSRAVVFERIYTDIEFGFEDAMNTGIFTGVLNGFVYGVLGFIHQHSELSDMRVNIQPKFDSPCFRIRAGCIVRLKNVHIIIAAINLLKIIRKIKKTERSK